MRGLLLARVLHATVGHLLTVIFRTRVTGGDNIPPGAAILAGNHVSYMDPVLMWCVSPRTLHFMAKSELWENPLGRWALPRLGSFPVKRGEPDRTAITTATSLLEAGELVGLFPEGHRSAADSDSLGEAQGGTAFIALRANAPIVPVAFVGTEKVWPRGARLPKLRRTFIHIGRPLFPSDILPGAKRRERVEAITRQLMERIESLLEEARGAEA
jgi:1-acyl-sn-glycerol-3-phosphate acyltransferase